MQGKHPGGPFRRANLGGARTSLDDVRKIRHLFHYEGWTQRALGARFNLSTVQIGRITRGEAFRDYENVPEEDQRGRWSGGPAAPDLSEAAIMSSQERLMKLLQEPVTGSETPFSEAELKQLEERARGYGISGVERFAREAQSLFGDSERGDELLAQLDNPSGPERPAETSSADDSPGEGELR